MTKKRSCQVLLAEDNDDDAYLLQDLFSALPVRVSLHVVRDGLDALGFIMKRGKYRDAPTPDMVILDIGMPKINGIEVLQYLNKAPAAHRIPKILLTGLTDARWIEQGMEVGADAYLMKPVSRPLLLETLRVHLPDFMVQPDAGTGGKNSNEVLIVEDNDDDILLIREAIAGMPVAASVRFVRDGGEAVAYLRREAPYQKAERPAVVVLDLNLPKKSGFEVLREIKSHPETWDLPVVMFTTSEREVDIRRSFDHGACLYITKPSRFDEYRQVIRRLSFWLPFMGESPSRGEENE